MDRSASRRVAADGKSPFFLSHAGELALLGFAIGAVAAILTAFFWLR